MILATIVIIALFVSLNIMLARFCDQQQELHRELASRSSTSVDPALTTNGFEQSTEQIRSCGRKFMLFVGLSAAVVLFLMVRAFGYHSKSVDRTLTRINRAITDFKEGKFTTRVELQGNEGYGHKLGNLADRVNQLGLRLQQMQATINEHHQMELEKAERLASVGVLAASMAHEIRNPVAGISNAIQVLSSDLTLEPEHLVVFDEIQHQTQRINRAINNLLTYARPVDPQLVSGDLNTILQKSMVLMEGQIQEARIKLIQDFDPQPPHIMIDDQQLQQVFVNLILNAIQAMAPDGVLTLKTEQEDQYVCASVSDTGVGIPDDQKTGIFEPFFTTKPKGTGLGLAICKSIIQKHGGRLTVSSEIGSGAAFKICLPLSQDADQPGVLSG